MQYKLNVHDGDRCQFDSNVGHVNYRDFEMDFSGKVVLITGAASGIGAGAARHFAKLNAMIAIVDLNEKGLCEVADQIVAEVGKSSKPLKIVADVTEEPDRIINETVKHFGRLDVLVNNAGILKPDSLLDFNANDFDRVINVNLRAPIILTQLAVPHLEKTKGNVVNTASIAASIPVNTMLTYCLSKAGIDHFTKCAAVTLADKGIRVNAISPGVIRTNIFHTLGINDSNADQFYEMHKNDGLVGRVGTVADTSAAIAYLANASFTNGTSFELFFI